MSPLPSEPYEPASWFPDLKVGNDYLASDGMNKHSVPYDLIGEKVNLRLTPNTVEVFFCDSLWLSISAAKYSAGIRWYSRSTHNLVDCCAQFRRKWCTTAAESSLRSLYTLAAQIEHFRR